MIKKTELEIMKLIVSSIEKKFTIREISHLIKKPYALTYNSVISLIKNNILTRDDKKLISLNYRKRSEEVIYAENSRRSEFLKKNNMIELFINDVEKKLNNEFFISILFGSTVKTSKNRDIDILFVIEDLHNINKVEKMLRNISENFTHEMDIQILSIESAFENISKVNNKNILNETLNNHIILFGTEEYYRLLRNAR